MLLFLRPFEWDVQIWANTTFFHSFQGGTKRKNSITKKSRKSAAKCAHRPICAFPLSKVPSFECALFLSNWFWQICHVKATFYWQNHLKRKILLKVAYFFPFSTLLICKILNSGLWLKVWNKKCLILEKSLMLIRL